MSSPSVVLRLPVPPSVNAAYRNTARGRCKTKAYTDWLAEADALFMTQKRGLRPINGPCELSIRIPAKTRGDASNRIKLAEDFLVSRQITGDDKHNRKVSIERDASLTDDCVVTITPAEAA